MSVFDEFLLLGNVWDVASALSHQKLGFKVIGTSSGAVAASLGYEDGEDLPFAELLALVADIRAKVDLPLSVDLEAGYARDVGQIISHIQSLADLGVVGINLEDSVVENGVRRILPVEAFGRIIGNIKAEIGNLLFLNARTDGYIMGLETPFEVTAARIKHYAAAGADGIFVPCIIDAVEIKALVDMVELPLNVMCMPDLPDFKALQKLGVMRISMGPFGFNNMVAQFERSLGEVIDAQSFKVMFG